VLCTTRNSRAHCTPDSRSPRLANYYQSLCTSDTMIETLHTLYEIVLMAKLEIAVFILAAGLHFLLFSNLALRRSQSKPPRGKKLDDSGDGLTGEVPSQKDKSTTSPSATVQRAIKPLLRSGAKEAALKDEVSRVLDSLKVPEAEREEVLADVLDGLGRHAEAELLAAVRALVPKVTTWRMAEHLLRFVGTRAPGDVEALLAEVESHHVDAKETLPHGVAVSCHQAFHRILDTVVKTDVDRCWDVLKRMEALGLSPNNVTCSILLKGVQKGMQEGYLQKVMKIIDAREVKDMDEVLLGSLYEACIRCGQVQYLLNYVKRLREESGFVQVRSAHTVGSIIRAYGAAEDVDGVWATWNEMKRKQIQPTRITLGCMVEALASNNDAEGAYEIIQQALADPETATLVNAVTYSSVLKSFNHQKRFHRVWEVYEEMIKQKVEFSVTTYNALLDVCARSGEISRAEPLLKDMADQGVPPNIITYGTVIKAYCSANRLDQAFAVLEEMQKNTSLHPDEVTYNTLLDGCARYGLFDRGLEVLADMRRAGVPPSNYTLSVIAKLANRSKKPKKAFEMVDTLRKEFGLKLNMHVYNNLIHAATCDSNMMKAQEVFGTMLDERVRPDGRTYTLLLRFCITQKAAVPATALLRTAFGLKHQKDDLVKTGSEDSLHPLLVKALLRSCHWAAAPLRGNSALQEEVIQDSFDFLSRSLDSSGVPKLLSDVQKSLPSLKLPKSTTSRIFAKP